MNDTHVFETGRPQRAWPVLRSAQEITCDGVNPRNDRPCVLGQHQGKHRDELDNTWLDDGDLARPDWYSNRPYDPRD